MAALPWKIGRGTILRSITAIRPSYLGARQAFQVKNKIQNATGILYIELVKTKKKIRLFIFLFLSSLYTHLSIRSYFLYSLYLFEFFSRVSSLVGSITQGPFSIDGLTPCDASTLIAIESPIYIKVFLSLILHIISDLLAVIYLKARYNQKNKKLKGKYIK